MLNADNLHDYQRFGVKHIIKHPASGLFLDMGLGKTVTTLTAIVELKERLEVNSVLVIAPKRVAESVWMQEAKKWGHTKGLTFSLISGPRKKREEALRTPADVYLVGRDNVGWLCSQYGGSFLPFDMLIIDELSSFKNPQSQRFKALKRVRQSVDRIVGLTGTPAPNGLIDLWPQVYLLDGGQRLGRTLGAYRSEFFKPDKQNGGIVYSYKLRDANQQSRIYSAIGDICVSMKAEDYLDMPDKIMITRPVTFDAHTASKYAAFERDLVLSLLQEVGDAKEISVANAAALSNKLLQFSNGAVYDEQRKVHEIHELKLQELEDIQEAANGRPLLVAVAFQHDAARILQRFKSVRPRVLNGQQDIDDWNEGKVNMLILHPASGGHGLNIQKGSNYIVWFGLNWSLELYKQLNARLWRQGQRERAVYIYHIVNTDTIDSRVLAALSEKEETENELMGAVKADKAMVSAVRALIDKYR
jgi:SNF2 family DNA or RNA helicase